MMIGIAEDGDVYLATTALAFPDNVSFRSIELLPPSATYEISLGTYKICHLSPVVCKVQAITPALWTKAYRRIEAMLCGKRQKPVSVQDLIDSCADLWDKDKLDQGAPLVYEVMRELYREQRLGIAHVPAEGAFPGYKTNNFKLYLK